MTLSLLLLAHWIGDFVFQTNKMALSKSHSMKWLSIHAATYTGVIAMFSLFLFPLELAIQFVVINGILHFVTDFFTSRLASKYRDTPRVFFPIIGFDQLIHTLTLLWTITILR